MPGWNLVVNLKSNEEGEARRKCYDAYAEKHGRSLSSLVREQMDRLTGFKYEEKKR